MFLVEMDLVNSGGKGFEEERQSSLLHVLIHVFGLHRAQRHQLFTEELSLPIDMSRLGKSCIVYERKTSRLSYITNLSNFTLCLQLLKLTFTLHNYSGTSIHIPSPKTFKRTFSFPFGRKRKNDYLKNKGALFTQRPQWEVNSHSKVERFYSILDFNWSIAFRVELFDSQKTHSTFNSSCSSFE